MRCAVPEPQQLSCGERCSPASWHTAHCTTSHPLTHLLAHNQILKTSPALTGHLTSSFNTPPHSASPQSYLNIFLPPGRCLRTGEGLNPLCHSPHMHTCVHTGTQIHAYICVHTHSLTEGLPGPRPGKPVPGGQVRAVAERRHRISKHQARGATSSQGPATLSDQGSPRAEGTQGKGTETRPCGNEGPGSPPGPPSTGCVPGKGCVA